MKDVVLAAVASDGFRMGLVATAFGFGLRHGVDWDHIAAITDITGTQTSPRRSLALATTYAVGHGVMVLFLGTLAVLAGDLLPAGVDAAMERVVGVTLVALGVYVLVSLVRHGRDFRMRSRWMLLFSGAARGVRWARSRGAAAGGRVVQEIEHDHEHGPVHGHDDAGRGGEDGRAQAPASAGDHAAPGIGTPGRAARPVPAPAVAPAGRAPAGGDAAVATLPDAARHRHRHRHAHRASLPDDPFATYGPLSSFVVGVLHGVGAETPTQVLVFLAAARAGGTGAGLLLLVVFVAGLLAANTVVALVSTFGFLNAARSFVAYAAVAVVTGLVSIAVGSLFLVGEGGVLPAFFGGS